MPGIDTSLVASLVSKAKGGSPDPVAAWVRDGSGSLDDLPAATALAAIEAAVRVGNGAALATAKANARDKAVRKAAGAALHKLKAAGQAVPEVVVERQWSMGAEAAPVLPPSAFLSFPDPEGYFSFLLLATGDETIVFAGLAGGGRGHQEVQHTHLSRTGRRQVLDDVRRDGTMFEVPFTSALNLLEQAFATADHPPHEWDHLLRVLDEGTRNAARLMDPFARQEQEPQADGLALAVPLLDGDRPLLLIPDQGVVNSAVVEALGAINSPLELTDESRARRVEEAIDLAATATLSGRRRTSWALALDVVALLSEVKGWEELRVPARHSALALRAGWAGKDIPYVREIVDRLVKGGLEEMGESKA